ncbi:MAG: hypothetical protein GXP55_13585 [Deltaproteobacteria bacterium]|nr:hypothetical protein [Deltaproteobacteria bacterium]
MQDPLLGELLRLGTPRAPSKGMPILLALVPLLAAAAIFARTCTLQG